MKILNINSFSLFSVVCLLSKNGVSGFIGKQHKNQQQSLFPRISTTIATTGVFATTIPTNTAEESSTTASQTISLFSPCKINLFLRIIRKREDGYHDLASLFQAIGFGDTLELTPLKSSESDTVVDEFTCNMPGVPVDSSNLVLRALQLMREKTGVQQYFKANLIKQVPAQAGLGGGSANAATAMWAANTLMGNPATLEQVRVFVLCFFVVVGIAVERRIDSGICLSSHYSVVIF
jgi:hypothetical protein